MCGIVGLFSKNKQELPPLDLNILKHRGPDHQDMCDIQTVTFGHTRLAIVDVENGQQPLRSPDGRYHLISNGEIYNHQTWRQTLQDQYTFETQTDSEIILALYDQYGKDFIKHLDGMFAFALYDSTTDEILLARDPIGIKPLYYGWAGETLYFASEIKAIQHLCDTVKEFPPGHYFTSQHGLTEYYNLVDICETAYHNRPSQTVDYQTIYDTLKRAVDKRLMADVPVGVYLSGGLDSTIVASLVKQSIPEVHSFSVGIEGSTDLDNARTAAQYLGTQHHEYIYDLDEVLTALPKVIYHLESFDPSLVRSAIPNYFLAKLTRQYVTVVLTGEGADELYAGYHYLKQFTGKDLHDELVNLTGTLYNCNLQRCDRMTMAHSIEGRVPFLDTEFIDLSMRIPLHEKIEPQNQIEKWALRKAFEDILPDNVTWRTKEQFSKGAGSSTLLETYANNLISDQEFKRERSLIPLDIKSSINTKETLLYYRQFKKFFNDSATRLVHLWHGKDTA